MKIPFSHYKWKPYQRTFKDLIQNEQTIMTEFKPNIKYEFNNL